MTARREASAIQRPYCLRCYARLGEAGGASVACGACGKINVLADQRLYWTQEPRLKETEWLAKVGIVLLLGGLALLMSRGYRTSFGLGQGWAIGFPLLVGAILWETASKITRIKPYLNATLVWSTLPLVLGLPFAVAALWPAEVPWGGRAVALVGCGFFVSVSLGVRWLGRRLTRWRTERILRGQARA